MTPWLKPAKAPRNFIVWGRLENVDTGSQRSQWVRWLVNGAMTGVGLGPDKGVINTNQWRLIGWRWFMQIR